jgi:hypothetical protein
VNSRDITRPENADYIKVSPLEPDGFTKDGYDIAGYDKQGYDTFGCNKNGRNRKGQLGPLQRELNRIAAKERQARSRQFARDYLVGEIWGGGGKRRDGGVMGGADFTLRLGPPRNNRPFLLGLMAEASFLVPLTGSNIENHVGGGLRLAYEYPGEKVVGNPNGGLSVSGGVGFIDNATVPYLHIRGFYTFITGGLFIHFLPDDIDRSPVTWYVGFIRVKFP